MGHSATLGEGSGLALFLSGEPLYLTLRCNWTSRANNSSWLKEAISSGELMVCNVAHLHPDRNPVRDTANQLPNDDLAYEIVV